MTTTTPISGPRSYWIWVILAVFTAVKIPALSVPLFWDEVGVYGAAGLYMHDHTLSMLPASLPPELSRGHPLLYTFLQATWYTIFGDSVIGGHIGNLMISLMLMLSVWYIIGKCITRRAALIAVCLLAVQPIFFAQSVMVLPEVLLTLCMLWALYFWTTNSYIGFAIFATLAILTKETAVILPAVAIVHVLLTQKWRNRMSVRMVVGIIFPWLIFGLFLLIQKMQNGWYFFPYHGDNIKLVLPLMLDLLEKYARFIFIEQGRIVLSGICALAIGIFLWNKQFRIPHFLLLLLIWCTAGVAINCISFYLDRYVLFVLVGGILIASAFIDQLISQHRAFLLCLPVGLIVGSVFMYGNPWEKREPGLPNEEYFTYDSDMLYVSYAENMRQMIQETIDAADTVQAYYANWPITSAIMDTRYGYTGKKIYTDFYMSPSWEKYLTISGNKTLPVASALIADPGAYNYVIPADSSWTPTRTIATRHHWFRQYTPTPEKAGN